MRILIISYVFAPMNFIGSIRFSKFSKYLKSMGHDIAVISSDVGVDEVSDKSLLFDGIDDVPVYRGNEFSNRTTPWLSKLSKWLKQREKNVVCRTIWGGIAFFFGPGKFSWYYRNRSKMLKFAKDFKPEIVISTCDPIADHRLGLYIAYKLGIKWVADFRDPLYSDFFINQCVNSFERFIVTGYENSKLRLQNRFLQSADMVTCVSDMWLKMQRDTYDDDKDELHSRQHRVTNGYDPEDRALILPDKMPKDVLNIVYAGTMNSDRRDPTMLLNGIKKLIADGCITKNDVRLHYCGRHFDIMNDYAKKTGMEYLLVDHGVLSRSDAINLQAGSDVLLLLSWNEINYEEALPAKVYEYMLIGKPVLGIITGDIPNSYPKRVIEESNIGIGCEYVTNDQSKLYDWLKLCVEQKKSNGKPDYRPKDLGRHTHPVIVNDFSDVLRNLLDD